MNDREFRRRAHALLAYVRSMIPHHGGPEADEMKALLAAGPDDLRVVEVQRPGERPVRMVEVAHVRFVCPKCGPGVTVGEDWTCSTCGADVFREDAPWFVKLVREPVPVLWRVSQPCGCWDDVRAFNRCVAHTAPGEACGGVAGVLTTRRLEP